MSNNQVAMLAQKLKSTDGVARLILEDRNDHTHLIFDVERSADIDEIMQILSKHENIAKSKNLRSRKSAIRKPSS